MAECSLFFISYNLTCFQSRWCQLRTLDTALYCVCPCVNALRTFWVELSLLGDRQMRYSLLILDKYLKFQCATFGYIGTSCYDHNPCSETKTFRAVRNIFLLFMFFLVYCWLHHIPGCNRFWFNQFLVVINSLLRFIPRNWSWPY